MKTLLVLATLFFGVSASGAVEWGNNPTDDDRKNCRNIQMKAAPELKFVMKNCYIVREWIAAAKLAGVEKAPPVPVDAIELDYLITGFEEDLATQIMLKIVQKKQ